MLNRLRLARNQLLAFWKWCLSFRKSEWSLRDYPVTIHRQKPSETDQGTRVKLIPCLASIVNWHLCGIGNTPSEALADLEKTFAKKKTEKWNKQEPLPRPGTHVSIEFAENERVDTHRHLADDFIRRVLELDWAWISDGSSLWDFHHEETNGALILKIKETYGVDVSDIHSGRLCEIFERIAREDKFQRWQ
jgi:hypothetical protein